MGTQRLWSGTLILVASVAICVLSAPPRIRADDNSILLEIKARLDRLEKENQELREQLKKSTATGPYQPSAAGKEEKTHEQKVTEIIDSYMKEKESKKKAEETQKEKQREEEGYEVGKYLDAKARWVNNYLWFESEDKAFRIHVGGRTQIDSVWVHAPQRLMTPFSTNGIGEFDDAVNFRRARFVVEGTFWEVFDFACEYDFINTTRAVIPGAEVADGRVSSTSGTVGDRNSVFNTPVPTDLWIQWRGLPIIGNIRVGNQKQWIGFEHLTSSRFLNFMERSMAFDAFLENGNNGFVPGISLWRNLMDNNLFYGVGIYRPNYRDIYGWSVGDGETQTVARLAGTPIYREGGRYLVHLGLAGMYSTADDGVTRFRARTDVRNGPAILHNIIAQIQGNLRNNMLVVPEFWANYGPFSVGGEYYANWSQQNPGGTFAAVGLQTRSTDLPRGGRGSLFYQGGYVELGYFLTGESRSYNRSTMALDRQAVDEPAFLVDSGDSGWQLGRGAWQMTARYTYLDLNDKSVNGGVINDMTLGVNWFLNPNSKIQFNYSLAYRNATQYADGVVAIPQGDSIRDGLIQGFGTTFRFDY